MRWLVFALLALMPFCLVAPPASAAGNSSIAGGCSYAAGNLYLAGVVYSTDPNENLVIARVTCTVYFGDGVTDSFQQYQQGLVLGRMQTYYAGYLGPIQVCTHVEYVSTGDPSDDFCAKPVSEGLAGEAVIAALDARDDVFAITDPLVFELTKIPDPVLCPILAGQAPGVPGVVDITPQGDVYVQGEPQWDCPPYEAW